MTMVERVAKAIERADAYEHAAGETNYLEMARAAIAAMREPTAAMLDGRALPRGPFDHAKTKKDLRTVWQVMIDAALEEK